MPIQEGDLLSEGVPVGGSSGGGSGGIGLVSVIPGAEPPAPPYVPAGPGDTGLGLSIGLVQAEGETSAAFSVRVQAAIALSADPIVLRDAALLVDVSTFALSDNGERDLDVMFSPIYGKTLLRELLARRLLTRRGALDYAPDYGIDIRDYIGSTQPAAIVQSILTSELEKDPNVRIVDVGVTRSVAAQSMTVKVVGQFVDGSEFALSLSAANGYVELTE